MIDPTRMAQINRQTGDRSGMFYWQTDRSIDMPEFVDIFMKRHDNTDEDKVRRAIETALRKDSKDYAGASVKKLIGTSDYKSGSVNVNRLVVLEDGRELVLRLHPTGLHNAYFDVEAAAMNAAREKVPAPHIITIRHEAVQGGYDFMLMEKMPGHNMKEYLGEHPKLEDALVRDMGRRMAQLHEIKVDGFGFFDNDYSRQTGKLRGIHASFRGHVLAALPANLKVLVDAKYISNDQAKKVTNLLEESKLIACVSPRLLHNDMADWNVLAENTHLSAVLDWDECFGGDPVADIACWSLFFPFERLQKFLNGYRAIATLGDNFDGKLHIYRLRYVVSKMSLRHRKLDYQKDDIMTGLITAGLKALKDETLYFNL